LEVAKDLFTVPPIAQNILKWSKWILKMNFLLMLTYSHDEATVHIF
jgi:hypothetical protein